MKNRINLSVQIVLVALSLALLASWASAQNPLDIQSAAAPVRTSSKMLYHDGPIRTGVQDVYFIFYGCWTNNCGLAGDTNSVTILTDLMSTIGNTPYMYINSTYTDTSGQPATPATVYAGAVFDNSYSHGAELTTADIEGIIYDQVSTFQLPHDPHGIYVVVASADISSLATGFCTPGAPPFHSNGIINGAQLPYIFIGNSNRCPTIAGPQFLGPGGTPNGSFAGDSMAANLVHALNGLLTNPYGNGWFDRYGLENSDKCSGSFGTTYTTASGARANIRLGSRDFLLEQNWINNRKGGCVMSR